MKLHLSLKSKVCMFLTVLVGLSAHAEQLPLVEVELRQDNLASYHERREPHGTYLGVSYEAVEFGKYVSSLDGKTYNEMFGSDTVNLVQVDVDYKYNFTLGSLAFGAFYGIGAVDGSDSRKLDIKKYGLSLKYTADMLMQEPYVAPYLGIQVWQMGYSEESNLDSFSSTTQMGLSYTVGVLLQLNWIDYETAKLTTFSWGLENTFVDLYAVQYAKTQAADDPNFETDMTFGAGIRMEF